MKENKSGGQRVPASRVRIAVSAKVLGEAKPEDLSKGVAYAFSKGGALIGRATLNQQGSASLELTLPGVKMPQSLRLVIGPDIKEGQVSIAELMRRGGEETLVRIDPDITQKDVLVQINPEHILCWLLGRCLVQGRVLKKVMSGGIPMNLPVCDATVEIYEVDSIPVLIPKLPDEAIEKIREVIINPPPPPPPDPWPFRDLSLSRDFVQPPLPIVIGEDRRAEPLMLQEQAHEGIHFSNIGSAAIASRLANVTMSAMGEDMQTLRDLAGSTNTSQFRQVLVDQAALVKHIICLLPYGTIHTDLVATASTDQCRNLRHYFSMDATTRIRQICTSR